MIHELGQVLIQRRANAIGQRTHPVRAETERPSAANAGQLAEHFLSRVRGSTGEASRKMNEISRPIASETAAVSDPALAVLMNTSNGWSPPFSLMVT